MTVQEEREQIEQKQIAEDLSKHYGAVLLSPWTFQEINIAIFKDEMDREEKRRGA